MAMPGSSRSKKIMALIKKNKNKAPDQESTIDKSSYERLPMQAPPEFDIPIQVPNIPIQVPPDSTEVPPEFQRSVQGPSAHEFERLDYELERLIPEQPDMQDSSSSSSSSSDSSDTFYEDSDDSVRDPLYTQPEQPNLRHNLAEVSDGEIEDIPYNDENIPQNIAENEETVQDREFVEERDATVSTTSPPVKIGRKRKRNENKWKKTIKKTLEKYGTGL